MNRRRVAILVFASLLFALVTSGSASGHATLESSEPPADSLLAVPPRDLTLTFTEPIDIAAVSITAVDQDGSPVTLDTPRLDPGNDRKILISSGDFSIGSYTVSWSNRSATDGHTLSGSFAFRVGGTTRAPAAATVEGERPPVWGVLLRWLTFLGAAPAVGLLLVAPGFRRRRIVVGGLAIAQVATLLEPVMLWQFPPSGSTTGSLADAVRAEPSGWWVRLIGLAIALLISLPPRREEYWRQAVGAAGLFGLAGLALTAHAAGRENFACAATAVAFLHNATIAIWIGALALIVITPAQDRWTELREFSRRALLLAITAILAGLVNAGLLFPNLGTITSTDYGRVLIGKIAVVAVVIGLAAYHHLTLRRKLAELPHLMRRSVQVELGLVALVVAFGSTLALLAPPQETQGELARIELAMPTGSTLTTDQVFVRLTIDPAKTGQNALTAYATQGPPLTVEVDAGGTPKAIHHPPLVDVQLIRVTLASIDLPIAPREIDLTPLGDGRFQGEGVNFSANGWWRALVTVRRDGAAEDLVAEFILRIPDPNVVGFSESASGKSDAEAQSLFTSASGLLAGSDWVKFRQDLSGGNGGVEISTQTWSNGGIHISTPGLQLIRLDGKRYLLDQSGEWRVTDDSEPGGPASWVADLAGATDFVMGNQEQINGRATQAIHFFVPGTILAPAFYTWWIDLETGYVVQEAMVSRSHYMIQRYDWSAPPPEIVPPV